MFDFLNNQSLLSFFIKAFALVFSIIFLLFTVVVYKQTQTMNKTLSTSVGGVIVSISFLQMLIALIIVLLAFTII